MKLLVILGSTREGRTSDRLAKLVANEAKTMAGAEVELLDLRDYSMPFFNEPMSPRYNPNRHIDEVAQKWLHKLEGADAYIFVTPEYNHSIPGVLKNAIDYITWEIQKKPATIASHGTVGGARAIMHLKDILSESRAAVTPTQLAVIGMNDKIDAEGNLSEHEKSAQYGLQTKLTGMLQELKWYSDALAGARSEAKQ